MPRLLFEAEAFDTLLRAFALALLGNAPPLVVPLAPARVAPLVGLGPRTTCLPPVPSPGKTYIGGPYPYPGYPHPYGGLYP